MRVSLEARAAYASIMRLWMTRMDVRIEVLSEEMAAVLRKKTGAERLAIADGMYTHARQMLLHHLRAKYPEWDSQQVGREAARRLSHGTL
jgi:hypothetical protein